MARFQKENMKVRILKLASLKSTGNPAELALKLGISPRSVKRLAHELRQAGHEVRYCRSRDTYVTDKKYNNMF
jgi:biotin operon repressor